MGQRARDRHQLAVDAVGVELLHHGRADALADAGGDDDPPLGRAVGLHRVDPHRRGLYAVFTAVTTAVVADMDTSARAYRSRLDAINHT